MQARLATILGGTAQDVAASEEWQRQALWSCWGVSWPHELRRELRGRALQRMTGVLLALEDLDADLAFRVGARGLVAEAFARYFDGACLPGPPWKLDPREDDLPAFSTWNAARSADFEGAVT